MVISPVNDYQKIIDLNGSFNDYKKLVEIKVLTKDFSGALKVASNSIKKYPNIAKNYFMRANIKRLLKDNSGASIDYSMAINIRPNYADAYFNRGKVTGLKNLSKSCSDYKKASSLGRKMNMGAKITCFMDKYTFF